jgi:3'-phosphoadenosine 5'-phosphosulfate sulfotransferase (PAPS reductase)/FAD synthetase
VTLLPLREYDHTIIAFSGGKDSMACLIQALRWKLPNIECWHHDVDGRGGQFMDWPITADYCRKVCAALGVPLYFSWRHGGFEREMLRDGRPTAHTEFEMPGPNGTIVRGFAGGKGQPGRRMLFPQVSADLSVRWCSAYLKIDVGRIVFNNDPRFTGKKILFITGERGEESTARAKYLDAEEHQSASVGKKRLIHQWRPIKDWTEQYVWNEIARLKINPHPGYRLGWGRISCMTCIFGDKDQWASVKELAPAEFKHISDYEVQFGKTIHRKDSVLVQASKGRNFMPDDPALKALAMSHVYTDPVFIDPWVMPPGAFKRAGGPT